ncbi:putative nucleic acid-binding protein [Helianthus annuus]|uniref:Nucleic acid-binding protein n=1 Tax=Helianthus annuus TaxID=4232 RepID=A0A9K3ILR6_HELAN|nr:putative nucleic acid-binding protein [Helianthus annuus]
MVPMVLRMLWFWSVRTMAVTVRLFTPIRVPIRVQDCTGIVTLTLFEREVLKLLKVNASQLLDKNLDLTNEGNFPPELNALLNRKFAFKIATGSFNIQNKSDGYSVSKLTDNPTVISELDKIFDVIQPLDEERVNVVSSDMKAADEDSISRTKADETPVSNFTKGMFTTPYEDGNGTSLRVMENELKRNLDSMYDADVTSSQSSTKPRKAGKEVVDDDGVTVGLLIPKETAKVESVDLFSDLKEDGVWYSIIFVSFEFVWHDKELDRLIVVLLDQQRQKIAAIVPINLTNLYPFSKMVGGLYSLSQFKIENLMYHEYPRYEGYIIVSTNKKIVFNEFSEVTPFLVDPPKGFFFVPVDTMH